MRPLAVLLIAATTLVAQEALPAPQAFLGYELGAKFTLHARIDAYARLAAKTSPRITLTDYGRTHGGRPLVYLVITSEANHRRMAEIREAKGKLADPRTMGPGDDAAALIEKTPVTVWLSYNVHGNEPSPSETALKVIHRLATADDAETKKWLDGAITIVDPCLNPDGRDRYAYWFNGLLGGEPDPDPQAYEHQEPWPGGRYNHWYFDLNRDWAFATQVETRSRLPHFNAWSPQVHVDYHEMGHESTYFFFPAEKPINANLPEHTMKWGKVFGRGNAKAFDERGWFYYTAESFDLFYPGYGDSWPSFTGAIGMTYEQGGHSSAGAAIRRRDGHVLTLKERLEHHEVTSYATVDTAVSNRTSLVGDFHAFRKSAIDEGRAGTTRSFLIAPAADPGRAGALVATLLRQGIEVHQAGRAFTLQRVRDAMGKDVLDRTFPAGTWVVDLAQPLKRLAKTLLEPRTEIRELYFYDVSAWSLPLAYGVTALQCPVVVPVPLTLVTEVKTPGGGIAAGDAKVGWLLAYHTRGAMEAMVSLLRRGVKIRSARKGFTLGERTWARGTIVVRRNENPDDVAKALAEVGVEHGVSFVPAETGFTEKGIDLGSGSVVPVVKPRIALCGGDGTSSTSFGSTRFLLDQVLGVPYSVVKLSSVGSLDLERFTAVVVPSGSVPSNAYDKLRQFASKGGVVVAFGGSAASLCGKGRLSSVSLENKPAQPTPTSKPKPAKKLKWIEEREAHGRTMRQPGSIFRVELDPAHPVSFGYRTEIAAFKNGSRSFDPAGSGTHVGLIKGAEALSGYVNDAAAKRLEGRAYVTVDRRGRGAFVLFADDPNFRGAWRGLTRLFLNATLLMPQRYLK